MAGPRTLPDTEGRLAENIVHFARALRKAGVRVGPAQVEDAVRATRAAGFTRKADFYHLLRATMVTRAEHLEVFHQVFTMFWRDPEYLEALIHMMSPTLRRPDEKPPKKKAGERRASEALEDTAPRQPEARQQEVELEVALAWSAVERLKRKDFEQMSAKEAAAAAAMLRDLRLPLKPIPTRRATLSPVGRRPDLRRTLRASMRRGGEVDRIAKRRLRTRPPDLVALCDISGSMASYSRMMMHFLHALAANSGDRLGHIHAFTFGTRLTNVTRALHMRDADAALEAIGQEAQDWEGGTLICGALHRFNRDWSRRVLGQGAAVLLITDGLERDDPDQLAEEARRLRLSCRRLIWLNPLLRWEEFAPRARGVRALLSHVDSLHACHNLESLEDLARAFATDGVRSALTAAA